MSALSTTRLEFASPAIPRGYVAYLQSRLLEAEASLAAMTEKYDRTKARFDRCCARRGIDPDTDIVNYINSKSMNPELKYWYAKVEHFQREVTAYGAALTGIEAARRMLGPGGRTENVRRGNDRRGLSRVT